MDSSIGIGPISIGLDGLIGLIPGFGDIAGSIISALIVLRALQRGVHHAAIIRMVVNIAIDSLLGSLPIIGDAFDFAFKANIRNLEIYKQSLSGDRQPLRDWGFIILVVVILLAITVLPILGLIYLTHAFTSWLR